MFLGGCSNIGGYYPDLLAVLESNQERLFLVYFYNGYDFAINISNISIISTIRIDIIKNCFHRHFFHGHSETCDKKASGEDELKRKKHKERMTETRSFFEEMVDWKNDIAKDIRGKYLPHNVQIVEEHSCDFSYHSAATLRNDPAIQNDLLIEDILDIRFGFGPKTNHLSLRSFKESLLMEDNRALDSKTGAPLLFNDPLNLQQGNTIQGFLVVKGGTLAKDTHHPGMGFCVQRADVRNYVSEFTKNIHKQFNVKEGAAKKIVGAHNYKGVHVMHTSTYQFLTKHFGWDEEPEFRHLFLYKSELYQNEIVTDLLLERKKVIELLENCPEEEIYPLNNKKMILKLILNGCEYTTFLYTI